MNIPFTAQQFLDVFKNYNLSVWPMQIFFYLLAILAVFLAIKQVSISTNIITVTLSFFWLWMGIVYNIIFFTSVNKAAYIFGIIFIIQGILFVIYGIFLKKLSFQYRPDIYGLAGAILIIFALTVYPALNYFLGHVYPFAPTFGLPCPTTIFTLGLLLWTGKKLPVLILVIPLLWSVLGFSAAFSLGIYEDIGLVISGLLVSILFLIRNRRKKIPGDFTTRD